MKEFWSFLNNLLDKFDIKKLMLCLFLILALMLVPGINFLTFLMPLDNGEKWIKFIFSMITAYIILSILIFLWDILKRNIQFRPKKIVRMMVKYGEYLNRYYSEEMKEFSIISIDLYRYGISPDIINKLYENNIIEGCTDSYGIIKYKLTRRARIKLTRIKKLVLFIDSKIVNRNKTKEDNNEN